MSEIANAMNDGGGTPAPTTESPTPQVETTPTPAPEEGSVWYGGFSEEDQAYIKSKGWDSQQAMLKSYRDYEKFRGIPEDEILRIPRDSDPEALNDMYKRLGVPEDKAGYQFEIENESTKDWYAELAHELKLTPDRAALMVERGEARIQELSSKAQEDASANYQETLQNDVNDLKKEWGREWEKNWTFAQEAASQLQVDIDEAAQMYGPKKVIDNLAKLGRELVKDSYVSADTIPSGETGMSAAEARIALEHLENSKEYKERVESPSEEVRMKAVAEWQRLLKIAQRK